MFTDLHATINAPQFTPCLSGKQLLADPVCRNSWQSFREYIPLSDLDFEYYYTATLIVFAEYVQTLPATQHVFYAFSGGFFQLGLNRAITATKLALQTYQDAEGLSSDQLNAHDLAELFAVFSAALLSDLGLLTLRFQIKTRNSNEAICDYDPYEGSILSQGNTFAFQFRNPEFNNWPAPASLILAQHLLSKTQPEYRNSGFAWISRHHDVLQLWYAMLLELTPPHEDTTRQRYLISLIPQAENDLIHNFLENLHQVDWWSAKKHQSLFAPNDSYDIDHEISKQNSMRQQVDLESSKENTFNGEEANSIAGSTSTDLPSALRFALAFLAWLQSQVHLGKLTGAYKFTDNQILLNIDALKQDFARDHQSKQFSTEELVDALKKLSIIKPHNISLRQFMQGKDLSTTFNGLVMPNIYHEQIALMSANGLTEIMSQAEGLLNKIKPSSFLSKNLFLRFLF